jgi:hypothetical protein
MRADSMPYVSFHQAPLQEHVIQAEHGAETKYNPIASPELVPFLIDYRVSLESMQAVPNISRGH